MSRYRLKGLLLVTLLPQMVTTQTTLSALSPASRSVLRKAVDVLLGMSLVNAGNYAINVVYGRYLEAGALGDAILVTTFLLLMGAVSTAIQTATARLVACSEGEQQRTMVVDLVAKAALATSAVLVVALVALANPLATALNVAEATSFYWLGATAPLLLLQGAWRGALQGKDSLMRFVGTFQVEMLVRLVCSWIALEMGLGVAGVCAALLLSVLGSLATAVPPHLVARVRVSNLDVSSSGRSRLANASLWRSFLAFAGPAMLVQLSVIVFAQLDVILVKSRTSAEAAGSFAIVVLLGRVVSFTGQVVATPMLPAVAMSTHRGHPTRGILNSTLAWVAITGTPIVVAAVLCPSEMLGMLFGEKHVGGSTLLSIYAIGAFIHVMASVLTDYGYAVGRSRVTYAAFAIGVVKLALGFALVSSAKAAVVLHLAASVALLVVVLWLVRLPLTKTSSP